MHFLTVPSRQHPIYLEWKKWADICDTKWSHEAQAAKDSIARIAEHIYKDHRCIVGHMIMERDHEQMEAEEKQLTAQR